MKTYLWKLGLWIVFITIMVPVHLHAACQIVGYTIDGYIIECDGSDTFGITSGDGVDIITVNSGAQVSKTDQQSTDSTATATATTIDARRGDDQITNKGSVSTDASTTINANDVVLTLLGSNETNASVTGDAIATGINSNRSRQKDSVTNNGTIDVTASSKVIGGQIQFDLFDVAKVDATLRTNATATGIKGFGNNEIVNNSRITVTSTASVTAWTGEGNTLDQATANTTITPTATAVGISGGSGYDKITNTGIISATANAEAYANVLELNAVDAAVMGAGVGSVEEPMKSAATGISVGNGGSEIVNSATGKITANASSVANIASVILTLYDFTLAADISKSAGSVATNVSATSTGISGGRGRDIIINDGEISANATSIAMSEGLGVGAEGVPSGIFPAYKLDIPLADATITATSEATGIQSGASGDRIVNTGKITADADTITFAMNASVSFPLLELIGAAKWWNDYPPAIAIAGAGTEGKASAWGIRGGEGNDTISNSGNPEAIINVNATSIATTNEASVTLQNLKTAGGGFPYYANLDLSLANAATKAESTATGIDGEGGNDFIENKGTLTVEANSIALGNAASVAVEGLKGMKGLGVAIVRTKVGTEGTATAMGIIGGEGNDKIYNTGQLDVDANSLANSFSANVSVQGEMKGVGVGVAFADATTTSTATVTGISGGDGEDFIINEGLHAYATSEAYAESFSVVVQAKSKGVEIGGALALGTTTATATVTGMDGGTGDDTFLNQGLTDVKAEATANTLAASVDVQASVKGVGAGIALIDTTTSTATDAIGVSGSDDRNFIINNTSGTIKVHADSNTYAEQFAVTVQGESTGLELGGALVLGSTTATAAAMGISGGKGGDEIYNDGMVDVRADATTNNLAVAVDVQGSVNGLGLGVAFSDVSSTATTTATGISSGEGNDTIHNSATGTVKAYAESDSYSEVFSVNVQGKGTGIMIGGAVALAGSTAKATATGMDGGAGKDDLINEGFTDVNATSTGNSLAIAVTVQGKVDGFGGQAALTETSTSSTATAFGISGGDGQDTITNSIDATVKSHATAEAYAESVSVSVQGYGTGVTMAGSLARGVTTPTASAVGISGGEGDDILINQGLTDVKATTDSTSVAVAVRAVGVIEGISVGASLTDTSTIANATAVGMDAGLGNDVIYNSGAILANTDSTLRATSVSFDFGGVPIGISVGAALASAATNATGTAIGISGGEGDDNITNAIGSLIDVDSTAEATSTAVSVSANVIGAAWTNTSATTLTQATGIAGGEGRDRIANMGTIDVDSNSTAKVANVSFNLIGATPVSGWTSSTANAKGIDAGVGDDWIQNEGIITADSISTTDATGVAVQIAGYSNMDINTNAIANSTGITAGDGVNIIYNTSAGSIQATAKTDADTTAVNINLLGYSKTDGSSTGAATAIGIAGGKEGDSIRNDGAINSTATSDIKASSTAVQLVGYGESNAKGISNATIKGIDGGDGNNTLINMGTITGTATANANASSYDIQLAGGAKTKAGTEATATAIGIAGGKDMDTIRNEGTINLAAASTLVSSSRSYKIFGTGFADADSKALVIATGIDGSDGANNIANVSTGSITVSSDASATATGMAANIGVAGSSASTTSKAQSTGMKSGGGEDTILNGGILNVNATSSTYAGSGDFSLFGLSFGDALTEAIADGIVAGDGKDVIINRGAITVAAGLDNDRSMAYSNVDSVSLSLFNISSATFGSKAQANGIIGGGGDDTILNVGTITVGDEDWMAKGRAYGFSGNFFEFFSLTSVGATAETVSTGIESGDGNDNILNDSSGVLTVKATSYVRTEGAADTTTFGSPAAFASSATKATATGISGGEGNDVIDNKGVIDVYAHTFADAYSDSWVGWGSPRADSSGNATATAVGISAGEGQNFVTNSGAINVRAPAETIPYAKADSDVDTTDAETTSYLKSTAFGILAGDGGNTVNNTATGKITVTAIARTYDAQGSIAKAESDEKATVTAGSVNNPINANAAGVLLGNGNDTVTNDGTITVSSRSDALVSAYSNSWPYDAQSDATAYAAASAKGIVAGVGANEVINNGQININAWSHANPITDSWSRDQTAIANATADSNAVAIGIEADGNIINTSLGNIGVTARTTTYADANTNAETTTATAILMATATGIGTASGTDRAVPDRIQNDGIITVNALAGEDENNNPKTIALADTDVDVRSDRAEATGTSTVDAAGIRVGDNDSVIINNGNLTVLGRGRAYVNADAFSRDYNPTANAYSNANSSAVGIQAEGGSNTIRNSSLIDVDALAEAKAQGWADSWSSRTYTNVYATSIANATGISVGNGDNIIYNEDSGTIDVNSAATGITYSSSDENAKVGASKDDPRIKASVTATGISAVGGTNQITNDGSITVKATATRESDAFAESDAYDTDTAIWAVVEATATGIANGTGSSLIINNGVLQVSSTASSDLYTDSDSNYDADAKTGAYAYSNATGIEASADNSDNPGNTVITNSGTLKVSSAATAKGNSRGDSGAGDGNATTYAEATASAFGFVIGNGNKLVSIENSGTLEVKSISDTFAYAHGDDNSYAYAKSFGYAYGIKVGDNNELVSINNSGTLKVESTTTANVADDEPTMNSEASTNVNGIKIGNSNSVIVNSGTLDIRSSAKATIYSDEGPAARTVSSAYATGISTGNRVNTISNDSFIQVIATAESNPSGGNSNSTNTATAQAIGIKTGSNSDTITLGTGGLFNVAANATTFSYKGVTDASAIGMDAGDGANQITNQGFVSVFADATAEVKGDANLPPGPITYPATAVSNVTGIKSGTGSDIINNYGEIMVNSEAGAVINQVLQFSAGTKSATANAMGIDAGDGDNFIANYGTIDVSALAAAGTGASPRARTDGVESTTAIGIMTGDGNDTIIHSGIINTANKSLEWISSSIRVTSQPGIAITTGAGNDTVILTEGSYTGGSIELGDGDDTLKFIGTATVTGEINPGVGSNSLIFEGAGSLGYNFQGFENTTKQGSGTFTLASLPTMKRLEVNQGTLQINSNYAMANDSTFQVKVNGDGSNGQLRVNGAAELNGSLQVIKGPGPYKNGTTYDILEADAVNNTFSNVMLPAPNNFVSFGMDQYPNLVQIEAYVKDFTWLARNRVEWAVANYLDRILPSATGELLGILGQFQNFSQSEYSTGLSSLSPDSYDNFTRTTFSTTHRYTKSLQYRMNNVRSYLHIGQLVNEEPILLAFRGPDAGELYNFERVTQVQGKYGFWLDAFGQWGDQGEKDGYTGFDYFMRGATLGFDHALSDKFMTGISVGYSRSDVDLDDDQGSGYIKSLYGSLYGSYFYKNLYIDGILSYGRNWYDNHRLIKIGTDQRRAYSKHDGDLFSAYLQGGYSFDIQKWLIGPFASLQYVYLDEESFREKGAGGVSLNMDRRQTNSLVSELGVRLARVFKTKCGSLIPEVSAAWLHDFDIDGRVITSSFAGFPGASFSIRGQDVDRNGATLGAGITFIHKSGLSTSLRYMGEFRGDYKSNGVMGEIRFTF